MLFTKEAIWNACEVNREIGKISAAKLSKTLFPQYPNTIYATRRNLLDGGMLIPFSALQFFGLKQIIFSKRNIPTGQVFEAVLECANKSIVEIMEQLVSITNILAYNTPVSRLPQTLRKAMQTGQITSRLSLSTFEKAFKVIGNVEITLKYADLDMEAMF